VAIAERLLDNSQNVLITRADPGVRGLPLLENWQAASISHFSGVIRFWPHRTIRGKGKSSVSAPAPATCLWRKRRQLTAEAMGNEVEAIHDIGSPGFTG